MFSSLFGNLNKQHFDNEILQLQDWEIVQIIRLVQYKQQQDKTKDGKSDKSKGESSGGQGGKPHVGEYRTFVHPFGGSNHS